MNNYETQRLIVCDIIPEFEKIRRTIILKSIMDMEYRLMRDKNRDYRIPLDSAIRLLQWGTIDNLSDYEAGLRELRTNIFFIARDLYKDSEYETRYPTINIFKKGPEPKYTLYISQRNDDAERWLDRIGITEEENFNRLKETGFLMPTLPTLPTLM